MASFYPSNIINQSNVHKVTGIFRTIIGNLAGPCITNTRNYDKKLCELTGGLLIHQNKTYWDAITSDGFHIENKKCQGPMWFNLGRYARIHLRVDEDSKIETFTAVYKYKGSKVIEILIIETQNITNRLLKKYIETDSVETFYAMYNLCDLPLSELLLLLYTTS